MSKVTYKVGQHYYECDQFISTMPEIQWPEGVVVDSESNTGWSVDGREIKDTDWVIYKQNGKAIKSDGPFNKKYKNAE